MQAQEISLHISGSKSLSNRYLILNEVLGLTIELKNSSDSEDTELLKQVLEEIKDSKAAIIDINHAGTAMRFLTAYLSCTAGTWILTGSERMQQRPILDLAETLKLFGAEIFYLGNDGFPPLKIVGKNLEGGKAEINSTISSQFISAILLAAPLFKNGVELTWKTTAVSKPYIKMTIELLNQFGVETMYNETGVLIKPTIINRNKIKQESVIIESDWSSASYWYNFLLVTENKKIILSTFYKNSLQADSKVAELYLPLGIKTTFFENKILLEKIIVELPNKITVDFTDCPDIAQTLAIACVLLKINVAFTGLQTLKVKETDRIIALQNELQKLGAKTKATNSELIIETTLTVEELKKINCKIATYNDHRMAMAFAPLFFINKNIEIENKEVVKKSYPNFWEDFNKLSYPK